MIMISSCFSINTWLNYNPLKYYFIYLHWPLHGTPLIARVAVLTVDVEHEGVLYCTVLSHTVLYCIVLYCTHSRCRARGCPGWTAAAWRGWAPGTAACGRGPRCSAGAGTATCPPSATRTQIYLCTWYTSVCRYFGQHNNNCSVTICLAASS